MAVVPRITKIRFDNGAGSSREWVGTAAVQDTAAGSSVSITITNTPTGALAPGNPDTFTLTFNDDLGGLLRTVTLDATTASQTVTFFFTANGISGGGNRWGTSEMVMQVIKTTGGPTNTYNSTSNGSTATAPTTFTNTFDRGWVRGTTTASMSVSNVSPGGATPSPFAYGDSIYQRLTTADASFYNTRLTLAVGAIKSALSALGSTNFDVSTHSGVVDNSFPASSASQTQSVTVPNSALTGSPITVFTTLTAPSATYDPRITRTPLFQLDDNTYATPPLSKDVPSHLRQAQQQGFLAERFTNARGEGVNGITYNVTLTPTKPGGTITAPGNVTQTQGGQTGWGPSFLAWASSLPGGEWTKSVTITAPNWATGASYLVQAAGTNLVYTLVATNPNLKVVVTANHPTEAQGHMRPGLVLALIAHVVDRATGIRVPGAQIANPRIVAIRNNPNAATPGLNNGRQYLNSDSDTTSAAWVTWAAGNAYVTHPMTFSSIDSTVFEKSFTNSAGWSFKDIVWGVACEIDGVTYGGETFTEMTDAINQHDKYTFDGPGFVGFPSR